MTSRLPSRKLTDVIKRTSPAHLEKANTDVKRVMQELYMEDIQSRYARNQFLVDPRSLHLLAEPSVLRHYSVFALHKPAFCPMRRSEAHTNFHRVSMESFLNAALKSSDVAPTVMKLLDEIAAAEREQMSRDPLLLPTSTTDFSSTKTAPAPQLDIRVLNDLDLLYSGPIVVSLHPKEQSPRTLVRRSTMHYDALVIGHVTSSAEEEVDANLLFGGGSGGDDRRPPSSPDVLELHQTRPEHVPSSSSSSGRTTASPSTTAETRCTVKREIIGYYSIHPVTLMRVSVYNPPTSRNPDLLSFFQRRGTFVIGDPNGADVVRKTSTYANASRGDLDFPRTFVHLRQVQTEVDVLDVKGTPIGKKTLDFSCRNAFDLLLSPQRASGVKVKLKLTDGWWTPVMG